MNIEKPKYKKHIVLCRDVTEWNNFCDERMRIYEISGWFQGEEYIYACDLDSIRGLSVEGIIERIGFDERPDCEEIMAYAMICVRK